MNIYACIINIMKIIKVPHEVKNQRALVNKTPHTIEN